MKECDERQLRLIQGHIPAPDKRTRSVFRQELFRIPFLQYLQLQNNIHSRRYDAAAITEICNSDTLNTLSILSNSIINTFVLVIGKVFSELGLLYLWAITTRIFKNFIITRRHL